MKTTLLTAFTALLFCLLSVTAAYSQNAGKSIMENICDNRALLKEVLVQAGLGPVLTDAGPYTFFAPSDEALQKMRNADPNKLKDALMSHIIVGRLLKEDFKDGSRF
ncbi:fasciclin domain-containing protein [Adhaeribacter soli]|uniref:FAS1 domain-containing protein n=1 Tax=Adhaeribacter soli TaxID=2607655 RepID=A0A5N1J045_9BACT|nr:fasciclin domain-containing protein [Adhaeribacter soli]KAA9339990.1 hypothetical protein F0P94_06470 [Adhaeribacter soli]